MQAPDDPARKLNARAAEASGVQPLAERPTRGELTRRLSKLRSLRLAETPEQTIRAMRDGR